MTGPPLREAFEDWLVKRPDWWDQFSKADMRRCSPGAPRAGEYANTLLQQLWEAWRAGFGAAKKIYKSEQP